MENTILPIIDKIIIETINDQLKNISDTEHSRHDTTNFLVNLVAGLVSSIYQPKKTSTKWTNEAFFVNYKDELRVRIIMKI